MEINFLTLNENKTEIIIFGQSELLDGFNSVLGPLASYSRPSVRNLGVIFDNCFKFDKQISSVVKTSFFQLRLLGKVKAYLPSKEFEQLIHLFITSRLDYCNSLYIGVDKCLIRRLQLVQNAAARLLTGKRRYDHITPVLADLHWLPVSYRIQFKYLLVVFKSLHGLAPHYLSELLHRHAPARALRSAQQNMLVVPRCRKKP